MTQILSNLDQRRGGHARSALVQYLSSAPASTAAATAGLDEFSHLEVVFRFHLTDPTDLNLGARRPRDNPDWPEVGIFGHRNMRRLNWLGVSRCRLLKVDGLDLHVGDLSRSRRPSTDQRRVR